MSSAPPLSADALAALKNCKCAVCIACTCADHKCWNKAMARQRMAKTPQRPNLHYSPEDMTSASAAAYKPPTQAELQACRAHAQKPEWSALTQMRPDVKFEGQSVTAASYRGQQNPPPPQRPFFDRAEDSPSRSRPSLPFDAKTAYSEQYQKPDPAEAFNARAIPKDSHNQSAYSVHPPGAAFDGTTTNRREFRPYEIEPQRSTPVQPPQPRPSLPFEGVSQTQADYTPKSREPSQPLGHRHPESQQWINPETKFQATSLNADTYRGAQLPPQRSPQVVNLPTQRPSLPFEGVSQSKSDYRPYDVREAGAQRVRGDAHASHFKSATDLHGDDPRGRYETENSRQFADKTPAPCPAKGWASTANTPGTRTPRNY